MGFSADGSHPGPHDGGAGEAHQQGSQGGSAPQPERTDALLLHLQEPAPSMTSQEGEPEGAPGQPVDQSMMTNSLGQVFTKKMTGLTVGANITVACKFAFAGGMSVTKDFTYKVGDNCGIIPPVGLSFPIDFETGSYTFTDFDGGGTTVIDNPQVAGLNTSLKVGQMIKSAGATWGGSWIDYGSDIDFSTMKTIKMKVYSPRVGAKVLFKVENAGDAGKSYEVEATTTTANAWEQLTFDYSAINMANAYQHIVLIFDNGTVGDGSADFTYLFDDIDLVDNSGGLTQINLPVNFESTTVDYTLTDFGGNSSVLGADRSHRGRSGTGRAFERHEPRAPGTAPATIQE